MCASLDSPFLIWPELCRIIWHDDQRFERLIFFARDSSASGSQSHNVQNAQAGKVYVYVLTNYANKNQQIYLQPEEGTVATTSCAAVEAQAQVPVNPASTAYHV